MAAKIESEYPSVDEAEAIATVVIDVAISESEGQNEAYAAILAAAHAFSHMLVIEFGERDSTIIIDCARSVTEHSDIPITAEIVFCRCSEDRIGRIAENILIAMGRSRLMSRPVNSCAGLMGAAYNLLAHLSDIAFADSAVKDAEAVFDKMRGSITRYVRINTITKAINKPN